MREKQLIVKVLFAMLVIFSGQINLVKAQQIPDNTAPHKCGSDIWLKDKKQAADRLLFEQRMYEKTLSSTEDEDTDVYELPVVFHILHQNGPENLSDADLERTIELLNNAFAKEAPFDGGPSGVATQIRFCLGARKPDGSIGTAITRQVSALTDAVMETDDDAIKALVQWDSYSYINVWVVRSLSSLTVGNALAGYAMFPHVHGSVVDGIVIEAGFLGDNPEGSRVLVHEMGHYLGLYHTFEGGCKNDNCLMDGDRVCDTPPDASTAGVPCSGTANTCKSDTVDVSSQNPFRPVSLGGLGDQPDMHENYMDYGFQQCQNTFTTGQRRRMRDAIVNTRSSLLANPVVCNGCIDPITAVLNLPDTVAAGVPVSFEVTTTGTVNTVLWDIDGGIQLGNPWVESFSMSKNVIVRVYVIGNAGCMITLTKTIYVTCDVPSQATLFTAAPQDFVSPGETVHFETSSTGYTYTWQADGVTIGTGPVLNYPVIGTIGRLITLQASNGTCTAVSPPYFLRPGTCTANKENNIWYFGQSAGIDFNHNPPKAIPGKISTEEGCAVLCDPDGQAVYHSMGASVENSQTGQTLEDGDGLLGHISTTQSALFVPRPGSNQYVYLFSVDYQAGEGAGHTGGIYYSLIDRQGDGGKGKVIQKNTLLKAKVVEKVTAVKNLAGNGIWVIAHEWNSNAFYAWLVTTTSISGAVITHVGTVHESPVPGVGAYALGELKSSPSGKKLALAIQGSALYEVFDFNPATGVVSNPITLKNSKTTQAYGVAFSPNERYLYGSRIAPLGVIRFDLHAGSAEAINNSVEELHSGGSSGGALQLAPDGRIYCARRDAYYLSVINNPNGASVADCGFVFNGFKLYANNRSFYGLPNPIQTALLSAKPEIIGPGKVCKSIADTTIRYHFNPVGSASYTWEHRGTNVMTSINDTTIALSFSQVGRDTLIVRRSAPCNDMYDTLYIVSGAPVGFDLGPDTLVCANSGLWTTINGPAGFAEYQWSNSNSFTNVAYYNVAGTVRLRAVTEAGCVAIDSLKIIYRTLPELNLGRDTSLCGVASLTLEAPAGMDSYWWSTGETGSVITVADSGSYRVRVGKYGCLFTDTIHVWKDVPSNILAKDTLRKCIGMPFVLTAPLGFEAYSWEFPSGANEIQRNVEPEGDGWHILSYSNNCGTGTDSILVQIPRFFTQEMYETCADTLSLVVLSNIHMVSRSPWTVNSHTFDGDTIHFYRSGNYLVVGESKEDAYCFVSEIVTILVDSVSIPPVRTIDLGNDTSYCEGKLLTMDAGPGFDSYQWNNNRSEQWITVYGFGTYSVTARYCGYYYSDAIHITRDNSLSVDLGADKILCSSGAITLDAGEDLDWYRWNTGAQTRTLEVISAGRYSIEAGIEGCVVRDTIELFGSGEALEITGDTILCQGETIVISASSLISNGYIWDSLSVTAASTTGSLFVNQPGIYKLKNADCPADDWSDSVEIHREQFLTPVFHFSPDTLCEGDSVQVMFSATGYKSFTWSDGTGQFPKPFLPNTSGQLILAGEKCFEIFTVHVPDVPVKHCDHPGTPGGGGGGIDTLPGDQACDPYFNLVPNPAESWVELLCSCELDDALLKIAVFNTEGKLIAENSSNLSKVNETLDLLIQSLSSGLYVVRLETGTGQKQHLKWVITK